LWPLGNTLSLRAHCLPRIARHLFHKAKSTITSWDGNDEARLTVIYCDLMSDIAVRHPGVTYGQPRWVATVSAYAAVRQALGLVDGAKLDNLPYVLRGKLAGGLFGGVNFTDKGTLSLPSAGKTGE
jgi:hypothetical protein